MSQCGFRCDFYALISVSNYVHKNANDHMTETYVCSAVTSYECLKLPATRLFVEQCVHAYCKRNVKARLNVSFVRGIHPSMTGRFCSLGASDGWSVSMSWRSHGMIVCVSEVMVGVTLLRWQDTHRDTPQLGHEIFLWFRSRLYFWSSPLLYYVLCAIYCPF